MQLERPKPGETARSLQAPPDIPGYSPPGGRDETDRIRGMLGGRRLCVLGG